MKVIVYGDKELASLANFYLTKDSNYEVVGFTVDKQYLKDSTFEKNQLLHLKIYSMNFLLKNLNYLPLCILMI